MEDLLFSDDYFMQMALKEARKALDQGEVPCGAVVVCENRVVSKGYNQTESLNDSTAHAEIIALTAAYNNLSSKYIPDCTLYVTLEPCVMCAGALYWSQAERVVFGASDEKRGYSRIEEPLLHPRTLVTRGVLEEECSSLLHEFFKRIRNK